VGVVFSDGGGFEYPDWPWAPDDGGQGHEFAGQPGFCAVPGFMSFQMNPGIVVPSLGGGWSRVVAIADSYVIDPRRKVTRRTPQIDWVTRERVIPIYMSSVERWAFISLSLPLCPPHCGRSSEWMRTCFETPFLT
jgi:hypothetical protein